MSSRSWTGAPSEPWAIGLQHLQPAGSFLFGIHALLGQARQAHVSGFSRLWTAAAATHGSNPELSSNPGKAAPSGVSAVKAGSSNSQKEAGAQRTGSRSAVAAAEQNNAALKKFFSRFSAVDAASTCAFANCHNIVQRPRMSHPSYTPGLWPL